MSRIEVAARPRRDDGGRRGAGRRVPGPGVDRLPRRAGSQPGDPGAGDAGGRGARLSARPARAAAREQPQPYGRRRLRAAPGVPRASSSRPVPAVDGSGLRPGARRLRAQPRRARAVRSLLEQRCEALVLARDRRCSAALEELAARVPVVVMARALRSRR